MRLGVGELGGIQDDGVEPPPLGDEAPQHLKSVPLSTTTPADRNHPLPPGTVSRIHRYQISEAGVPAKAVNPGARPKVAPCGLRPCSHRGCRRPSGSRLKKISSESGSGWSMEYLTWTRATMAPSGTGGVNKQTRSQRPSSGIGCAADKGAHGAEVRGADRNPSKETRSTLKPSIQIRLLASSFARRARLILRSGSSRARWG
jgi:hypothetical protein